jgi:hypothetical protein
MSNQETQVTVVLSNVRLSYAYIFRPFKGKNDKGQETSSYSAHGIMLPTDPGVLLVRNAQRQVAAAAWGAQATDVLTKLAAQDKLALHDGNISKMGQEAYAGKYFVSANSKVRPKIAVTRGGVNTEIDEGDPCAPYSGCWANLIVAIYAQGPNNKPSQYGQRINAQLMGVQFLRHDEKFGGGGRVATLDEFPNVEATGADAAAPAVADASAGLV